jgi:hypothetical protein
VDEVVEELLSLFESVPGEAEGVVGRLPFFLA